MNKITLFGDIMCEPLLLKSAKQEDGHYNFDGVFKNVRSMIDEADYTIANLETPLAGEEAGYTNNLFSFNTPDSFADAIKNSGISLVTTANNHCLDRGLEGLKRTVRVLEEKSIPYFGTNKCKEDRAEAAYFQLGDQKIALISCTYGTNYAVNHCRISQDDEECIHLLHPHHEPVYVRKASAKSSSLPRKVWRRFLRVFSEETRIRIRKALHLTYNSPREDDFLDELTARPYFERLKNDIKKAGEKADIVIFYPHVGGQFNINPGAFTEYTFKQAVEGKCDAIIASHPHIVQKAEFKEGIPCFYSIGNFSMSPNSVYLLHEHLPDYGLAVHLYAENKKIVKTTFSILKIVENKDEMLTVYPVDEYCDIYTGTAEREKTVSDICQIYMTVTGKELESKAICREYAL